jgi:hypothetical protein
MSVNLAGDGREHLVEPTFDFRLKVSLDLVNLGEFGEGPATVSFEIVQKSTD